MSTQRSLVLKSTTQPLFLETVPIPEATSGSVVVKVLGTHVLPYLHEIIDGSLSYTLKLPLTPGSTAVGRIHAVGGDAVSLKPGQLVLCDITTRARDDPDAVMLLGVHGGAAEKLMEGEWRNGSFAEYAKYPLENVFALDEEVLMKKMGYTIEDFLSMPGFVVPYGGLSEIGLLPGDTVIVAPATGKFGGGAVTIALAMGATVIAAGRNEAVLEKMKQLYDHTGRIKTVVLTGNEANDAESLAAAAGGKGADAYIDFSPPAAANSTHISLAMAALRPFGKASFMGGIQGKVSINYSMIMMKSLRIQGRFMYSREMMVRFLKLLEKGNLKLGEANTGVKTTGKFSLDEIQQALEVAKKEAGWGTQVILVP
ncbi:hypothetical protein B7463_g5084, partial [Scytalidium lignicola]